jgi:hypothetical protein
VKPSIERERTHLVATINRLDAAADLSHGQASLEQRQRFQRLFFPDGIAFDGNGFVGTAVTAPAFSYLRGTEGGNERMVDLNSASWNQHQHWLRSLDQIRRSDLAA